MAGSDDPERRRGARGYHRRLMKGRVVTPEYDDTLVERKVWFNKNEVARLKGISRSWFDKHPEYYPNFGRPHRIAGNKCAFHRSEVAPWIDLDQDFLKVMVEIWKANPELTWADACDLVGEVKMARAYPQ